MTLYILPTSRAADEDGTQIMFNLYAVHHEKAKYLMRQALFHTSDDELIALLEVSLQTPRYRAISRCRRMLDTGNKQLSSGAHSVHLSLTESRYSLVSRDFEESAKRAKQALLYAQQKGSQQAIQDVRKLYAILYQLAPKNNPYVVNLGVELGVFPD